MDVDRINVKFFLEDPGSISSESAFRIFNAWISRSTDEVLVDVADYSHIHAGPVTVLVGHDANYSIDNTDDRLGLLYTHKQPLDGDLASRMRHTFAQALGACHRLEEEPELGALKFRGNEAVLTFNDRLRAPNTPRALAAVRPGLDAALSQLYGGTAFAVEPNSDPRERLTLHIRAEAAFDVASLLRNLGA